MTQSPADHLEIATATTAPAALHSLPRNVIANEVKHRHARHEYSRWSTRGGNPRLALPGASQTFSTGLTHAGEEPIEYDGDHHQAFNDLGKEQVLAGIKACLARHP